MSRHNQLDRIIGKAESLTGHLPNLDRYYDALLSLQDRLKGCDYSTGKSRGSGADTTLTTVEPAAEESIKVNDQRDYVRGLINAAELALDNAIKECRQALSVRIKTPRCDSTGRDGAIEWADPTCHSVPSRGPLCDRCAKREYRWRNRNGLPPRTDGLFTGDAA